MWAFGFKGKPVDRALHMNPSARSRYEEMQRRSPGAASSEHGDASSSPVRLVPSGLQLGPAFQSHSPDPDSFLILL